MLRQAALIFGIVATMPMSPAMADAAGLPDGFVYLRDIEPSILQDIRYSGTHNFVGRRIAGYEAGECILTRNAADALANVQKRLKRRSMSLKVYDCYRPARAVADFVAWASSNGDEPGKAEFYPTLDRKRLFALGYIATRSAHSRGSTVDVTIVPLPAILEPAVKGAKACHLPVGVRFADNSLDFGTGYDCFHERSHTKALDIGRDARQNRALLVREMAADGFVNYRREWWHFSLATEPFPKTSFDFVVQSPAKQER